MDKPMDSRPGPAGCKTLLRHTAEWSWARFLIPLCFSFLVRKKNKIIASASELVNKLIFTKYIEHCVTCSKRQVNVIVITDVIIVYHWKRLPVLLWGAGSRTAGRSGRKNFDCIPLSVYVNELIIPKTELKWLIIVKTPLQMDFKIWPILKIIRVTAFCINCWKGSLDILFLFFAVVSPLSSAF